MNHYHFMMELRQRERELEIAARNERHLKELLAQRRREADEATETQQNQTSAVPSTLTTKAQTS